MRHHSPTPVMVVDCDTCPVRDVRCDDCLVTAVRGMPVPLTLGDGELELDAREQRAAARLVAIGLVDPEQAAVATARREPWSGVRAVG